MTAVDRLVEQLIEAEIAEAEALERHDAKAQNRWADRRDAAIRGLLAGGDAGRMALERLLSHELPMVRLMAAASVIQWAPEAAVPALERLLAWAYAERDARGRRPAVASFVRFDCEHYLSKHYGVRMGEVVPLVLGIGEGSGSST